MLFVKRVGKVFLFVKPKPDQRLAVARKGEMMDFLKLLKKQEGEVAVFSDGLWTGLLDYATVYADGRMTFIFKNGQTIDG